jgi:ParB/RepB/Spo0J family partition protein
MEDELRSIPLRELREPVELLRLVDRESIDFLNLTDSVRDHGVLNSILVRPASDGNGYEIIDGLYRYCVSLSLDLEEIPCKIKHGITDDEVLILQIQCNAVRPPTSRIEYAKQIRKLLSRKSDMTILELARLITKSPKWVSEQLNLIHLADEVAPLVDRGEIKLQKAYALARLPKNLQPSYIEYAKNMSAEAFRKLIDTAVKQHREAVQQGRFTQKWNRPTATTAYLRNLNEIVAEIAMRHVGATLLSAEKCTNVVDAFYLGLRWAVHQDTQSQEQQLERIRNASEVADARLLNTNEDDTS